MRTGHGLRGSLLWMLLVSTPAIAAPPQQVARFASMPRPAILPDGVLATYFLEYEGPGLAPTPNVQPMYERTSRDEGATWSQPRPLFVLPEDKGAFGYFVVLVDHAGELHFLLLNDAKTGAIRPRPKGDPRGPAEPLARQTLDVWHVRSTDGRTKWPAPTRIWQGRAADLQSVIQLRNGRIVLPLSYFVDRSWSHRGSGPDQFTFTGQFDTTAIYSDDQGVTWHKSPSVLRTPTPDLSSYGGVEPVVIELKDGRVWMLLRTQLGRFFESFSANGSEWSPARPTSIRSSDSPAGLVRLPDGRILLLLNQCARHPYAQGARNVLHAALSDDDGRTWQHTREVLRDPHRNEPPPSSGDYGVAYPFVACNHAGIVFYSLWVQTGPGRTLERLDPAWLAESRQHDDFASGLVGWSVFGTRGVSVVKGPTASAGRAFSLAKQSDEWPAAAVRNFPQGGRGRLRIHLKIEQGFPGLSVELADHFSPPADPESHLYCVFHLPIGKEGRLTGNASLRSDRWSDLEMEWDCGRRTCEVRLDDRQVASLGQLHESSGPCYLRLRSMAEKSSPARLLIDSIDVDVSANR